MITFKELLAGIDVKELWYVLAQRHDLPPIRAERIYKAYCGTREEMLGLSAEQNNGGILSCELVVSNDYGGAPDAYFHCTISYPNTATKYALDFIDWAELIDCEIDESCLQKYGALLVTGELLWELTFHGFTRETVQSEAKVLDDSIKELDIEREDRTGKPADDLFAEIEAEREEYKNSDEEREAKAWFSNAPASVKARIFEKLKADVLQDSDDISDEVFAEIVRLRAEESMYKYKGCDTAESLICTMLNRLDCDDMSYLTELLLNGQRG